MPLQHLTGAGGPPAALSPFHNAAIHNVIAAQYTNLKKFQLQKCEGNMKDWFIVLVPDGRDKELTTRVRRWRPSTIVNATRQHPPPSKRLHAKGSEWVGQLLHYGCFNARVVLLQFEPTMIVAVKEIFRKILDDGPLEVPLKIKNRERKLRKRPLLGVPENGQIGNMLKDDDDGSIGSSVGDDGTPAPFRAMSSVLTEADWEEFCEKEGGHQTANTQRPPGRRRLMSEIEHDTPTPTVRQPRKLPHPHQSSSRQAMSTDVYNDDSNVKHNAGRPDAEREDSTIYSIRGTESPGRSSSRQKTPSTQQARLYGHRVPEYCVHPSEIPTPTSGTAYDPSENIEVDEDSDAGEDENDSDGAFEVSA